MSIKRIKPRPVDYERHLFGECSPPTLFEISDKEIDHLLNFISIPHLNESEAKSIIKSSWIWWDASGIFGLSSVSPEKKKQYSPILKNARSLQKSLQETALKPEYYNPFEDNFCESAPVQETLSAINNLISYCEDIYTGKTKISGLGNFVFNGLMLYEYIGEEKSTVDHSQPDNELVTKSEIFVYELCKISEKFAQKEEIALLDLALQEAQISQQEYERRKKDVLAKNINSTKIKGFCDRYPKWVKGLYTK